MVGRGEAEQAGFVAGTAVGIFVILIILALGDIILGALTFFTRAKDCGSLGFSSLALCALPD